MTWRYPYILFLLVVFIILWIGWSFQNNRMKKLFPNSSEPLMNNLFGRLDFTKHLWKQRLGLFGIVFLILSAAGPQIGSRVRPVERKGVDLVFAIDVSVSMDAEDIKPSRLEKSKLEVSQMIKRLKGDRVGIIVFAGSSHQYLPLTSDYEAAQLFLETIDTKMIPTQGTALSMALNTGISTFTEDNEKYKVLVLVTDGEDHEGQAVKLAEQAASTGIVIHSVGVGSINGSLIPIKGKQGERKEYKRDRQGKLVTSVLNEQILMDIADAGNGIYVRFNNRLASHKELLKTIDSMEKRTVSTHEFSDYEDRYQTFAAFALLFFISGFIFPTRRKQDDTWRGRFV